MTTATHRWTVTNNDNGTEYHFADEFKADAFAENNGWEVSHEALGRDGNWHSIIVAEMFRS